MYSVVLMVALTTSTDSVDFGHRHRAACSCSCACSGSSGCYGYRGRYGCRGCHGCCGGACYGCVGYGCYGGVVVASPTYAVGSVQFGSPTTPPTGTAQYGVPAPATIMVSLPAQATLTVDGTPTSSTAGLRRLVSPPLVPGNTYTYTLRAELDGQVQSTEVRIRAGEVTQTRFTFPAAAIAGR